ncbi:ParM/StbA family protein [Lamprocystis purpurea]|jgi:plasmid segregation protein ParM|uniref:ParM/StbA family protein n=1 Tax=Lamprocystis purpurea TaxID=61598 RepID=UPI00036616CB|nr:ParM/StbA family protein [Lamprocystis purpurea]
MLVAAVDVGYSNLKIAVGHPGSEPRVIVRPAGAAPLDRLGERIGERRPNGGDAAPVLVEVQGRRWAAGIEPGRFSGWARSLHEDYATTDAYLALVKAALVLTGECAIETVVTGLPVSQANDPRRRDAVRRLIVGTHDCASGAIEVGNVRVLPQPVGAYLDLVWSGTDRTLLDRIESGAVLVLDAGFYSFDWALIVGGELRRAASGTSLEAMSVLLDRAARRLADEYGGKPVPLGLEAAVRAGQPTFRQAGHLVHLAPVLTLVARDVASVALEALRQSLRREATNIDLVLLAGGGGELYGASVGALFPGASVVVSRTPVAANVRGFFRHVA